MPATPERPIPESWQKKIKDFTFDGIPLGEIVSVLRDQVPEMNFVITPDAAEYTLPPVRLNSVTLEDVFNAIRIVSNGQVRFSPEKDTMVSITRVGPPEQQKPKKQCVAYSLNRYLSGKPDQQIQKQLKDVEDALERCWQMLSQANKTVYERPALSLHAPTRMLIAVGDEDQLQVIEQIVRQLELSAGGDGAGGFGGVSRGVSGLNAPDFKAPIPGSPQASTNAPASRR